MKKIIKNLLRKLLYQRYYNWWDNLHSDLINKDVKLTNSEIKEIDNFFKRFTNLKLGYTFYKISKGIDKFDINYIPDTLYYSYILRHLNPIHHSLAFANKGLYGFYFETYNRPKEPVRKINGVYYNSNNQPVSEKKLSKF